MYIVLCSCIFNLHVWHWTTDPLCLPFATQSYIHKISPCCHVASPLLLTTAYNPWCACTTFYFSPNPCLVQSWTSGFYESPHTTWEPPHQERPFRAWWSVLPVFWVCLHQDRGHRAAWLKVQGTARLPRLRILSVLLAAKPYSLWVPPLPCLQNVNCNYSRDCNED